MSLGLGIFLAGLSIAIALLLLNPDTRRVIGAGVVLLCLISALGGLGYYVYYYYSEEAKNKIETNPPLSSIKLGEEKIDVIYKLGNPTSGDKDGAYFKDKNLLVLFKKNIVDSVFFVCEGRTESQKLNGISCGDPLKKINEKFKDKVIELCESNEPSHRIYLVKEFNSMYVLEKDRVVYLMLRKGSAPYEKEWFKCSFAKYQD